MPTLTGLDAPTFLENTVNATPQLIDGDVTLTDAEGDFDGGTLTLAGLLAEDRVAIRTSGAIAYDAGTGEVRHNGVLIGQATGGVGSTFTVTFNAAATTAGVEETIEHLTYANITHTPTTSRNFELFLTDAAGNPVVGEPEMVAAVSQDNIIAASYGFSQIADPSFGLLMYKSPSDPTGLGHYIISQDDHFEMHASYVILGQGMIFPMFETPYISDPRGLFSLKGVQVRGNIALGDLNGDGNTEVVAVVAGQSVPAPTA